MSKLFIEGVEVHNHPKHEDAFFDARFFKNHVIIDRDLFEKISEIASRTIPGTNAAVILLRAANERHLNERNRLGVELSAKTRRVEELEKENGELRTQGFSV